MNLNLSFKFLFLTGFFPALLLVSCQSKEQKVDESFEQVKEDKILLQDSIMIGNILFPELEKTVIVTKNLPVDEWTQFETDVERKIVQNENVIKKMKNSPNANTKFFRKLISLEEDNNILRLELDEYNKEMKLKRENFKLNMNQNIADLRVELNELSVNQDK
ncbi:MAG: hypothetical protein ACHQF2_07120 [Flavobacteriales bacterium]